jgi:hypothetical protein
MAAALALVAGCANSDGGTDENADVGSSSQDLVAMKSPEALARLLGTNHAVRFLGQFRDTRPGGKLLMNEGLHQVGLVLLPIGDPRFVSFHPTDLQSPAMQDILGVGRAADTAELPITVHDGSGTSSSSSQEEESDDTAVYICAKPGIHLAKADNLMPSLAGQILGTIENNPQLHFTADEHQRAKALRAETNVEVAIALPGPPAEARMMVLSFGVVKRALDPATGAPPALFWTILAVENTKRCFEEIGD